MSTPRWLSYLAALLFLGCLTAHVPAVRADTTAGLRILAAENPPLNFRKKDQITGFSTEVVRELMKRTDTASAIEMMTWPEAYQALSKHPNVVLLSTVMTAERKELFQWVGPVGKNSAILYAKKGSGIRIHRLEEARNLAAIATTTNWFTEQQLKRQGFRNLVSSPDPRDNVRQLMMGKVQLSVFTDITIPEIVRESGYSLSDLEPVFTIGRTYFYIALSRDTPREAVDAWQLTLTRLKQDGTFEKIYHSYLPGTDLSDLLNP